MDFLCLLSLFLGLYFWHFYFDPNKTHTGNFEEVPGWFARYFLFPILYFLHCLSHEAAHSLGGVLLHLPGDVGVGVQCEARAVVAQDAGDGFGVYTLLNRQRGKGVSQPVEGDVLSDSGFLQQGLVQSPQAVWAVELSRHRGREHHRIAGVFGVFLEPASPPSPSTDRSSAPSWRS